MTTLGLYHSLPVPSGVGDCVFAFLFQESASGQCTLNMSWRLMLCQTIGALYKMYAYLLLLPASPVSVCLMV